MLSVLCRFEEMCGMLQQIKNMQVLFRTVFIGNNCYSHQSYIYPEIHSHFSYFEFFIAQQKKTAESPMAMCWAENEDYFECVHGFKEKARILQIAAERKRREKLGEKFEIS
jgi:hypothetical protein